MRWKDLVKENAKRRVIQGERLRKNNLNVDLNQEGLMYMEDAKHNFDNHGTIMNEAL
jgi:hypothetical protein